MAEEKPLGILEMTKSGMTYSLALSMLGAQAAYRLAAREGEPLPGEPISEKGLSPEDRLQDLRMTRRTRAFADASMISLPVGLLVALAASLGISWYLTRRIGHPVELLTQAPIAVGSGGSHL